MSARLLIAYDGSAASESAVATAGRLFPAATGRLLTVADLPPGIADIRALGSGFDAQAMQRGLEQIREAGTASAREIAERGGTTADGAGLAVTPHAVPREGTVWQTILSEADIVDADVIVCGSRGRGGVARSLLGSTSTSVLHHAGRPVLVAPTEPVAIDGPALIAYDGSPGARAAVAAAARLLPGRAALVVHVWASPMRHTLSGRALLHAPVAELRGISEDYEKVYADAAEAVAEEGVALAREAGLDATGEAIDSGSGAWRAIAQAAGDRDAAVIVTGSRGHGALGSVLGSVSSGLVHNAETPALIVRPPD